MGVHAATASCWAAIEDEVTRTTDVHQRSKVGQIVARNFVSFERASSSVSVNKDELFLMQCN